MRINKKNSLEMVEGDMTPMIDMTFQLIAFFMVLINFSDIEQDQRINLPASELAKQTEVAYQEPITIQLTSDSTVLFGGDELTVDGLESALLREAQIIRAHTEKKVTDVTIIIRADRFAKAGKVQRIIQLCQQADFDTFALHARQSDTSTLVEP